MNLRRRAGAGPGSVVTSERMQTCHARRLKTKKTGSRSLSGCPTHSCNHIVSSVPATTIEPLGLHAYFELLAKGRPSGSCLWARRSSVRWAVVAERRGTSTYLVVERELELSGDEGDVDRVGAEDGPA